MKKFIVTVPVQPDSSPMTDTVIVEGEGFYTDDNGHLRVTKGPDVIAIFARNSWLRIVQAQ